MTMFAKPSLMPYPMRTGMQPMTSLLIHRTFSAVLMALALPASAGESMTSRFNEPYPVAASKKGLQVELVEDALALGVKHAALNINLTRLFASETATDTTSGEFEGEMFRFDTAYLRHMDAQIKPLSDAGVLVNLIVLAYASGRPEVDGVVLHPHFDTNAPNRLGAFNTVTPEGRRWFTACLSLLTERWSLSDQAHGRVVGYIIGNEVNSHWWWANEGRVTLHEFADDYLRTVQLAHTAIRRQSSWARVYLSLEHHWNIRFPPGDRFQCFPGREFLEYFAHRARERGDFDWNVAFHPYPEDLFKPAFWNDKTATLKENTPRITFKNLEMLVEFMQRPEMLYAGAPRRIILSEQGFHTPDGAQGEALQAAAYCYAYKKVEAMDGIDAFILHRHVDHPGEGGLLLGLRRMTPSAGEPRPRKRIYECFRVADTPQWQETFSFALPIVGLENWNQAVPSQNP